MSSSLFDTLIQELTSLLAPLTQAVANPRSLNRLLAEIGVVSQVDKSSLVTALTAVVDLQNEIEILAAQPSPSFESITAVLDISQRVFTILRHLVNTGDPINEIEEFGQDLATLLLEAYLAGRYPIARQVAVLLTLIEPAEEQEVRPPLIRDGQLLREPFRLDRFYLDRLVDLIRDPVAVLRDEYGSSLATTDDARAISGKLFPRLVRLLRDLGVSCRFGFQSGDELVLGDAAPLVEHALIVYIDDILNDAAAESGVVLTLSPADRGDLGLVISPFGALTSTRQNGRWTIDLIFTAGVDVVAYGRHGVTLLTDQSTTKVEGNISAMLGTLTNEPRYIFGVQNGTGIEVGDILLRLETSLSEVNQSLTLLANISPLSIVIAPSDGDGFLSRILGC